MADEKVHGMTGVENHAERATRALHASVAVRSEREAGVAGFLEKFARHRERQKELDAERGRLREVVQREEAQAREAVEALQAAEEHAHAAITRAEQEVGDSQSAHERAVAALKEAERLVSESAAALALSRTRKNEALELQREVADKRGRAEREMKEASDARQELDAFEHGAPIPSPYTEKPKSENGNGEKNAEAPNASAHDFRREENGARAETTH